MYWLAPGFPSHYNNRQQNKDMRYLTVVPRKAVAEDSKTENL